MLRAGLGGHAAVADGSAVPAQPGEGDAGAQWRVSSGSAAVLGLRPLAMDAAPTTAYLMVGDRCRRNCAFCAQARSSHARADALSRVTWPAFEAHEVARAVARAYARGVVVRACFQATAGKGALEAAAEGVRVLAAEAELPICVSAAPHNADDVAEMLALGAERVTIALDAATPEVYRRVKGGEWAHTWELLMASAARFPGHIGTHLIVGLGETEAEMVTLIQRLADAGVTIGLFAFTPVPGTAMAGAPPPPLVSYRRVQAALWLIARGVVHAEGCTFDGAGRVTSYGLSEAALRRELACGEAFRTAGCAGCNRPYYNERPGGVMYNYPRPLTAREAEREVEALLACLAGCTWWPR